MKKLIPIILILMIVLTSVVTASNGDIDEEPRMVVTLTEMLDSFVKERMAYHEVEYYAVWLNEEFPKGNDFKNDPLIKKLYYDSETNKYNIPDYYYFDVIFTSTLYSWTYDNVYKEDNLMPYDYILYWYRYYPSTGEYVYYMVASGFLIMNYGPELLFTNIPNSPHGKYEIGQYTILNPKGNYNYWGSGVEINHEIKLFDLGQVKLMIADKYIEGFNNGYDKGEEAGLNAVLTDNEIYWEGYDYGYGKGYDGGFRDGQTTTDETTRNILAFGGNVLGSIFSFILYVTTEIELFGIRLIDIMVAIAVIAIIVFVLKIVRG
jgi:hypothetical protein